MLDRLQAVIDQSGIWSGARKDSHAFLLSPDVYQITPAQLEELTDLGYALFDCLLGLSHIAAVAYRDNLNPNKAWILIRRVFSRGVPHIYGQLQGINTRAIPRLLKVDLMMDQQGNFRIAEIDGHNKHGLGYSTLGARLRSVAKPEAKSLPRAVKKLAEEIKRLEFNTLTILCGDQERFYLPEMEIARQDFTACGIDCSVVSEMDIDDTFSARGLFLDLPFFYRQPNIYAKIIPNYLDGQASFIIPPKPFLGSKGILGLLRNDMGDPDLGALLRTFIGDKSLSRVRRYIPETILIGKLVGNLADVKRRLSEKRYVLKRFIASGMKGTIFSDDPEIGKILALACDSNMNWVAQQEVDNQPQTFSWYEPSANGELRAANDWLMRITAHYVNRALADIIVTARRDKSVHGAKDCLQIGTVIVQ